MDAVTLTNDIIIIRAQHYQLLPLSPLLVAAAMEKSLH
jgi:hypothetical protein